MLISTLDLMDMSKPVHSHLIYDSTFAFAVNRNKAECYKSEGDGYWLKTEPEEIPLRVRNNILTGSVNRFYVLGKTIKTSPITELC